MPFYCYICLHRRILVGFFSKFKNNYSVKNTPTWSKFQLDLHIILYFMTYPYIRFELEFVQLLQSNKERKVNDDKRLEGQNGVTLYALGHFMARHKKI